jgi:hypothetical protein
MASAFEYDALWMKSKLFINHATDDVEGRTFDERAMWASFALECWRRPRYVACRPS